MPRARLKTKEQMSAELREAEAALNASIAALRSHGHQQITWELVKADGARVKGLHRAIAKAEGK